MQKQGKKTMESKEQKGWSMTQINEGTSKINDDGCR